MHAVIYKSHIAHACYASIIHVYIVLEYRFCACIYNKLHVAVSVMAVANHYVEMTPVFCGFGVFHPPD